MMSGWFLDPARPTGPWDEGGEPRPPPLIISSEVARRMLLHAMRNPCFQISFSVNVHSGQRERRVTDIEIVDSGVSRVGVLSMLLGFSLCFVSDERSILPARAPARAEGRG